MAQKRRRLVVTITETWTFVFDDAEHVVENPPGGRTALASIPAPSPDASPDAAPLSGAVPDQAQIGRLLPKSDSDAENNAETGTQSS